MKKRDTAPLDGPEAGKSRKGATISVIIPTRNEARHIAALLARLREMPEIAQIIVADAESDDQTAEIARKNGAEVVSAPGRGAQQNAGAGLARAQILWFLHADTLPARSSGRQIVRAAQNGAHGGHFQIRFASKSVWARIFEQIARVLRFFGIFYGDSGIWLRRDWFDELGGFQNWPLFEDYDLARRLMNSRRKVVTCAGPLRVSARRFEKNPARILGLWLRLQIAFWLGVAPEELATRYRK